MTEKCKWHVEDVIAKSSEQKDLLTQYRPEIEARVGAEVIDLVISGGGKLRESYRKQVDTRTTKTATTQSQRQALQDAADFLVDRRKAIATEFRKDKGTRDQFGLSLKLIPTSAGSVTSALEVFINAAQSQPDKLRAAAITVEDVEKMKGTLASLEGGEESQEGKKSSAKASTAARVALQIEIEAAMVKIVNAAAMVFDKRPEVVALFKSTLPKAHSRSRKGGGDSPAVTPSNDSGPK